MKEYKVDHYTIGVERLDKKTKQPIEHIEIEKELMLSEALKVFDSFILQNDTQKYINAVLTNGNFVNLCSAKRITTGKVWAEPINLENADGFVIDLSTAEKTYLELEGVLHDPEDRASLIAEMDITGLRAFILEYYISTYQDAYILLKEENVWQIIEEELYTKSKQ